MFLPASLSLFLSLSLSLSYYSFCLSPSLYLSFPRMSLGVSSSLSFSLCPYLLYMLLVFLLIFLPSYSLLRNVLFHIESLFFNASIEILAVLESLSKYISMMNIKWQVLFSCFSEENQLKSIGGRKHFYKI